MANLFCPSCLVHFSGNFEEWLESTPWAKACLTLYNIIKYYSKASWPLISSLHKLVLTLASEMCHISSGRSQPLPHSSPNCGSQDASISPFGETAARQPCDRHLRSSATQTAFLLTLFLLPISPSCIPKYSHLKSQTRRSRCRPGLPAAQQKL